MIDLNVDFERHDLIKRRLRARGITFVEIANELGVSTVAVSRVCQGRARSARVQTAIAQKLGVEPSSLWPERYEKQEATMKK
ncbi:MULTISPECIES: helix-turn-helix domain-containing protein [Brucella]|uniref:DNA-binding protein n=5 Tax=Brucella TaxID=234 RepID=A0AAI8E7X4_BRUSS|nr:MULTISPECIES: helix-turn-helix domain-containing protein [Brucella]AIN83999.1 DNA-binding protein [Brucella suis]AIN87041.1 DNA-binding protein [Brucella suis]AOG52512.1 DNA-binding protein [Brucella melitensis]AQQ57039.1 transcriptional regulator [Brucella melitensis]ARX98968.1 DNA-binding protein [Brucella melitensis]